MVDELLAEIMRRSAGSFEFSRADAEAGLARLMDQGHYTVLVARDPRTGESLGFLALSESHALYNQGAFGIIPELYVRAPFRSRDVGRCLLDQAKVVGASRGWKYIEVTTPPLPEFDKTLAFYEREGFRVTGGRKLKLGL